MEYPIEGLTTHLATAPVVGPTLHPLLDEIQPPAIQDAQQAESVRRLIKIRRELMQTEAERRLSMARATQRDAERKELQDKLHQGEAAGTLTGYQIQHIQGRMAELEAKILYEADLQTQLVMEFKFNQQLLINSDED